MDTSLSKLREMVKDREAWRAAVHGLQRVWHDWATKQQQKIIMALFQTFFLRKNLKRRDGPRVLLKSRYGESDFPSPCSLPSTHVVMALHTSLGGGDQETNSLFLSLPFLKKRISLQSNLIICVCSQCPSLQVAGSQLKANCETHKRALVDGKNHSLTPVIMFFLLDRKSVV